jgi:hypothetical protein
MTPFGGRKSFERGDQNTLRLAKEAFEVGEKAAQSLIVATHEHGGGMPDSIYTTANLAIGVIHSIAMCVGKAKWTENVEDFDPLTAITAESMLFSVILVNKMSPDFDPVSNGSTAEFGPHILYEALETYERYTGKKPDEFLMPGLVKAAREVGAMGKDVVVAFMERTKHSPPSSNSLN